MRYLITSCLTLLLLFHNAQAEPAGQTDKLKILLVGDSVTAGMYFLNLSDKSASQGWASQLLLTLGIEPDLTGFKNFYPTDNMDLTKNGFGLFGIRNFQKLLPNLFVHVEPISGQYIAAISGQTVNDALNQSSKNHSKRSASWIFARLLLADNKSFIKSIQNSDSTYDWIIVFLGSNDLLSSFGMLGDATPPNASDFKSDYRLLIKKLITKFKNKSDSKHLLLLTLPDVTDLPVFAFLPEGAKDADGNIFPKGTKTFSFLSEYREITYESSEVFSPEMLRDVKKRVNSYNRAIKEVAVEFGGAIVDLNAVMMSILANDPDFNSLNSSYFSPDLHHPSFKTHSLIMKEVLRVMQENSEEKLKIDQESAKSTKEILPSAADLTPLERKRANSLMRTTLLIMEDSRFPPRPTYRSALETGGRTMNGSAPILTASGGLDFSPIPVRPGWVSRFTMRSRLGLSYTSKNKTKGITDFFIGFAFEPQGKWDWRRFEFGAAVSNQVGWGLYSKFEWHKLYFKATNLITSNAAVEGGIRFGKLWGRMGHNGN